LFLANGVTAVFNDALSSSGKSAVGVKRKNKAAEAAGPVR
jgi:hypothetical protein